MTSGPFYKRAAGTSLLLAACGDPAVPVLLHWGADLGDLSDDDLAGFVRARTPTVPHSALDSPRFLGILPDTASGFTGTPAVEGFRMRTTDAADAVAWAPRFVDWAMEQGPAGLVLRSSDAEAALAVTCVLDLLPEGLVRTETRLENTGDTDYVVGAVRSALPVAADATELLDLTGRWARERSPQRRTWAQGTWQRTGRHGRTGHDATLLLVAGTPGFGFRSGTVWGVHVAWSGDHVSYAERTPEGESLLGGHELLGPGEVMLAPGEAYSSPTLFGSWSEHGMDGMSERLHRWVRRHAVRSRSRRPVTLNTWEAVYFDHDLDRLTALADAGAEVGVERFVLDDGWFRGRRHDRAGLGDWTVDRDVWPEGLHPLVEHVRRLGMEFGLWVEPEMVNADSDLAREHPGWMLRGRAAPPGEWRHQQVLDLQRPDAYAHVRDALAALLDEYDIGYLKWDHNRDLVDVAHGGRPAVHGQTTALYRLLDELREAHPALAIESCASGGGRVDLGILWRTDRIWPSDTIDALERQHIQRWTTLLVPPEMMGTHVGGPEAHTTGRQHRLGFRAATALIGHFGVEWDIMRASPEERDELAAWIALHKELRGLIASGSVVHGDHPDPALLVTGVVAPDASEAVYVVAAVASLSTQTPTPLRLCGLDPSQRYEIARIGPDTAGPDPLVLAGSTLVHAGVRLPVLAPESALVLHAHAR
ncbi:MAG TPA: alpha-galactosidase [Nocardioidaceae bacterium]|nr:alpha-galactosidase [Nocardioidaceae bacterium]